MRTNWSRTLVGGAALSVASLLLHGLVSAAPAPTVGGAAPSGSLMTAVRLDPPEQAGQPTPAITSEILDLVNAERAARGLHAITADFRLGAAAQAHSEDQARRREMSHVGADGSNVASRVDRVGYVWRSVAENVAYGYPTPTAVMAAWMASDGHRRNILSANTQLGVGHALGSDGRLYWTQVFAAPQ